MAQGIVGVRHIGITVSDMARSIRFYTEFLGLCAFARYPNCEGEYYSSLVGVTDARIDIAVLQAMDGFRVELLQYLSHPVSRGDQAVATQPGRPHCAFTVGDLGALYQRRLDYGCAFKHAPQPSADGVLVAYCHDPDGTILELVQPKQI